MRRPTTPASDTLFPIKYSWDRLRDNRREATRVHDLWSEHVGDLPADAPDGPMPPWIPSEVNLLRSYGLDGFAKFLGEWGEAVAAAGKAARRAVRDWQPGGAILRVHSYEPLRRHLGRLAHRLACVAVGIDHADLRGALHEAWASFERELGMVACGKPFPADTHDSALRMLNDLVAEGGGLALIHEAVVEAVIESLDRVEEEAGVAVSGAPDKVSLAIAAKVKHPDWTAVQIAALVGCSAANLSKSPRWQAVCQAAAGSGQQDLPREGKDARARDQGGRHLGGDAEEYADPEGPLG
jgi:hypothetical protein